jgi:hypothetical protein
MGNLKRRKTHLQLENRNAWEGLLEESIDSARTPKRRRTGKEIDPATMGWTTVMTSCILAEQLFDFIP